MITPKTPKNAKKYVCETCDFGCSKQSDWDRHVGTARHQNNNKMITPNAMITPKTPETPIPKIHKCSFCGKEYKHQSGLSAHKKKCSQTEKEPEPPAEKKPELDMNLIIEPIKKMMIDHTQLILEQAKLATIMATTENNKLLMNIVEKMENISKPTISNPHKPFNLNNFLNDTCKNAISFTDFMKSIKVEDDDLVYIRQKGYIAGFTHIFLNSLNRLDKYNRPFWNTDENRKTIYVKKDDVGWVKDEDHKAIKRVVRTGIYNKSFLALQILKDNTPEMSDPEHKKNDEWLETFRCIQGKEPWHKTFQDVENQKEEHSIEKVITRVIQKIKVPKEKCDYTSS